MIFTYAFQTKATPFSKSSCFNNRAVIMLQDAAEMLL